MRAALDAIIRDLEETAISEFVEDCSRNATPVYHNRTLYVGPGLAKPVDFAWAAAFGIGTQFASAFVRTPFAYPTEAKEVSRR